MYALGVGSGADRAELEEIASRSDYVSISPSFKDLLSISSGLRQQFCSGKYYHYKQFTSVRYKQQWAHLSQDFFKSADFSVYY